MAILLLKAPAKDPLQASFLLSGSSLGSDRRTAFFLGHSRRVPVSTSVSAFTLLIGTQSHWIRAHSNDRILTCSSTKTLFPDQVTFAGPEGWDGDTFFGGHCSTRNREVGHRQLEA